MTDDLTVFVRGLRLNAEIGLHAHERGRAQPLIVDIALEIASTDVKRIGDTVDYDCLAEAARTLARSGHIELVESFADRLATACLSLRGASRVTIRVEKPDAVSDAVGAGVELTRGKTASV